MLRSVLLASFTCQKQNRQVPPVFFYCYWIMTSIHSFEIQVAQSQHNNRGCFPRADGCGWANCRPVKCGTRVWTEQRKETSLASRATKSQTPVSPSPKVKSAE